MHKKTVHIVSFDVPFPPNYGGVIDVYYKIKALHEIGINVILHAYIYGRKETKQLEDLCFKVYYYKRKKRIFDVFSIVPFIVKTRNNKELISNLVRDNCPIIFEGLHSTFPILNNLNIQNRSYVRTHNIEHVFAEGLAKSESSFFRKLFFKLESIKLKKYESVLHKVKGIFTIASYEQEYFSKKYGGSIYIPVFHPVKIIEHITNNNKNVLFHGNLNVSDNKKAALFLVEVYKNTEFNLTIASSYKDATILKSIKKYDNIYFKDIPTQIDLNNLFQIAHINVLTTSQKAGIKLKLLNALYKGKFVLVNSKMIEGTGLESLCKLANTKSEFLEVSRKIVQQEYTKTILAERMRVLSNFNPKISAQKIVDTIF